MTIKLNGEVVERTNRNDLHNTFSPKHHKPRFVPSYKNLYRNQLNTNYGLLMALGVVLILGIASAIAADIRIKEKQAEINRLNKEIERAAAIADQMVIEYNLLENKLASCSAKLPQKKVSTGKVSYYSHAGCIGCSPNQIMANGKPFDENAMTLAHNQIPLNTKVWVTNLDNGKTIQAVVTDTGGFNKYSRIADLSKGLYEALGAKTDKSIIEIAYY